MRSLYKLNKNFRVDMWPKNGTKITQGKTDKVHFTGISSWISPIRCSMFSFGHVTQKWSFQVRINSRPLMSISTPVKGTKDVEAETDNVLTDFTSDQSPTPMAFRAAIMMSYSVLCRKESKTCLVPATTPKVPLLSRDPKRHHKGSRQTERFSSGALLQPITMKPCATENNDPEHFVCRQPIYTLHTYRS